MFACEHIPAFTCLLEDHALLSLAKGEDLPQLWERYQVLPLELKQDFDALGFSNRQASKEETLVTKLRGRGHSEGMAKEMARVSSRFEANSFKTDADHVAFMDHVNSSERQQWAYALFPKTARVNHSCTPNAHAHCRPESGSQMVYSLRDIQPGDEIEIAYFDFTMSVNHRQDRAKSWGFRCTCAACTGTNEFDKSEYDRLLLQLHKSLNIVFTEGSASNLPPAQIQVAIQKTEGTIDIASSPQYPWLVATLPRLYEQLTVLLWKLNESVRVTQAMMKSQEWETNISGPGSPANVDKRLVFSGMLDANFIYTPSLGTYT